MIERSHPADTARGTGQGPGRAAWSSFGAALLALLSSLAASGATASPPDLLTVAEASDYRRTARHAEVQAFCERLAAGSPSVTLQELGRSHEGRVLPLLIVADPPVLRPEDLAGDERLLVLLIGGIHGGEICGKEALLMLARELAAEGGHPLLKDLVVAFVPLFNADGNERIDPANRKNQVGPTQGVGQRANGQGLDLNRDQVKLESPESRALLRFLRRFDPALVVDTHTTNGSHHRYHLTWAGPKHPATDPRVIAYVRDEMLPEVAIRLEDEQGWRSFHYGNFDTDRTRWATYPELPRYGTNARGLRQRLSVLSEAHAYIPFRDRVQVTLDFCRELLEHAAENRERIAELLAAVDEDARKEKPGRLLPLRNRIAQLEPRVLVPGYVELARGDETIVTTEERDYPVELFMRFEPTLELPRASAYLIPPGHPRVIDNLQRHGVEVGELREEIAIDAEAWCVESVSRAERAFEGHQLASVEAVSLPRRERLGPGWRVVETDQVLGNLAAYLLEPLSEDGLAAWGFFDDTLQEGSFFPILRLLEPGFLLTRPARRLAEDREPPRPITFELLHGKDSEAPALGGRPTSTLGWLDGETYLQARGGRLARVTARTGRAEPAFDAEALASALVEQAGLERRAAERIAFGSRFSTNEARSGFLFEHDGDLHHARFEGGSVLRLTDSPGLREELAELSPDGRRVAFVRDHDLWSVGTEGGARPKRLTRGGSDTLRRGQADWVYFEEVFGRSWKTFWWSPDSTRLAFLEIEDAELPSYTVVDELAEPQVTEKTRYPKPGEPNPRVRLGIVRAGGGSIRWADLGAALAPGEELGDIRSAAGETGARAADEGADGGADEGAHPIPAEGAGVAGDASPESAPVAKEILITRVSWWPDGSRVLVGVQDRLQTRLDLLAVPARGGKGVVLLRERTGAWVSRPAAPQFLRDGSFLHLAETTGWKQLFHHAPDGRLLTRLSESGWELRSIEHVDEERGFVLVRGTRESSTTENLYRIPLAGGSPVRLSLEEGSHAVSVSPDGRLFIDTWSTPFVPARVVLRDAENGAFLRLIDSNPVHELEDYRLGRLERHRIPLAGGGELEASLLLPPGHDPAKSYPVWFMTYGGPHSPTVRDAWSRRRASDEMLAQLGLIVFRCDPRSASGDGAVSAWRAYRQLGVSELEDIEEAIAWLTSRPDVDAERIGMSGHSYGGFLTAYAMTHSELFAAGIAGAPVTDWRDYDSIYTERYMGLPDENAAGYDRSSVVKAADRLHGRLLIVHGNRDDNVHAQNTWRLVRALQQADRSFELMTYPANRHGIGGTHYRRLQHDFIRRSLLESDGSP